MKDKLALKIVVIVVAAILLGFVAAVSVAGLPASTEQPTGEIGSGLR